MASKHCVRTLLQLKPVSIAVRSTRARPLPQAILNPTTPRNHRISASVRALSSSSIYQAKKYSKDHEWIELDSDGTTGTLGISTYAANALGDVVYVELPQPDVDFNAGDAIGAVESVKSASDILSPVSCKVIEANSTLEDNPASINKSPEGEAWIAKVKVKDTSELDDLMDSDAYKKFTEE